MKLYEQDMTSWREVTPLLFKDFEQALQFLNYTCSAENKEVKIEKNRKTIGFSSLYFHLITSHVSSVIFIHTHIALWRATVVPYGRYSKRKSFSSPELMIKRYIITM